jgi:hypothetical protein
VHKRWHYIYVILYPELGYTFYYGSRVTKRKPEDDKHYFGSPKTFGRYNDIYHSEYQSQALKVILWSAYLPHCKKSMRRLSDIEVGYIRAALDETDYLGPDVCLNRNCAGRILLTPAERREIALRGIANGGGFGNMAKTRHIRFATFGGYKSHKMRAGIHGISPEKLKEAQKRGHKTIAEKYAKTYTFTSPAGIPVTFTNLKQFCRERGLNPGHMRSLNSGKLKSHKGWTKHD